jgi:hypothetical protein
MDDFVKIVIICLMRNVFKYDFMITDVKISISLTLKDF